MAATPSSSVRNTLFCQSCYWNFSSPQQRAAQLRLVYTTNDTVLCNVLSGRPVITRSGTRLFVQAPLFNLFQSLWVSRFRANLMLQLICGHIGHKMSKMYLQKVKFSFDNLNVTGEKWYPIQMAFTFAIGYSVRWRKPNINAFQFYCAVVQISDIVARPQSCREKFVQASIYIFVSNNNFSKNRFDRKLMKGYHINWKSIFKPIYHKFTLEAYPFSLCEWSKNLVTNPPWHAQ